MTFLDKFLSRKGLYVSFWIIGIVMVSALIYFTANLAKEVPPIAKVVKSESGEILYTYDDVTQGKGYFQQFDLMDYGTMLGMGAYMGPDFSTEFLHKRAEFLYSYFAKKLYGKDVQELSETEVATVKILTIKDFKEKTKLIENVTTYTDASAMAYKANAAYLVDFLVNGDKTRAWRGGVINAREAVKIAAFVDWSQMVASSLRPGTNRTWTNNWPPEPMIGQHEDWNLHLVSLWEFLLLWTITIFVIYFFYEYLNKREKNDEFEKPLVIVKLFPSQKKLLKYVPVVSLFFLLQTFIGGYLAHLYFNPAQNFLIPQEILPFNVMRGLHTNLAIIWVAVGWLVGGLLITPLVSKEDLKFPWLVDILWVALLVVGAGGLIGIYAGAQGWLKDSWFWLGNEGRELLNLGRVWDIGLVAGLVLWFGMVFSIIRKAKDNNIFIGTIIWSAFAIATLYVAGMVPIHKIMPNFTVDDYYRWWVVHLWVELTFELFAAGVLAYLTVSLGLITRKTAEKVMLFELFLILLSGTLGVGHHYWWQGLDEYWIAIGGIFSALEPLPLALLMIEAIKERKHIKEKGDSFHFSLPFLWLAGSGILNWYGAGFLGMVINTPTINYFSHGTQLIMPHAHAALFGAFGYIAIAFIYMTARANAMAEGHEWSDKLGTAGFWFSSIGVVLFGIPVMLLGFEQSQIAHDMGYYFARLPDALNHMIVWKQVRIIPDAMIIVGAAIIFYDLVIKIYFPKKTAIN
nr:cbb3-type cytochrome c oxidase subunit I [uncultured Desulfobacter sp.]